MVKKFYQIMADGDCFEYGLTRNDAMRLMKKLKSEYGDGFKMMIDKHSNKLYRGD